MGAELLQSYDLKGQFYDVLRKTGTASWVNALGAYMGSDKDAETYGWLGRAPSMQEWKGQRRTHKPRSFKYTIDNVEYEASLRFQRKDVRRDKHGQVMVRIGELAQKASLHWNGLLSNLIIAGESQVCYDGQYFFDTDHQEGDSGTQSNDLTENVATTTAPTAGEMENAIFNGVKQIIGFKDDQGDLMNEDASSFLIMVPLNIWKSAAAAVKAPLINDGAGGYTNTLGTVDGIQFRIVANPRLTWTDRFAVFRDDGVVKPFILQEEEGLKVDFLGEGSEYAIANREFLFTVEATRAVGFGYWQHACLITLT